MRKRTLNMVITLMFAAAVVPATVLDAAPAYAEEDKPDPRAEALLNEFMGAVQANGGDMDAAIKAAEPYLHRSLLTKDGSDVSSDLRRFSLSASPSSSLSSRA